jgi:hypothetical protein
MEEHLPFCPACGAPQIRVASPEVSAVSSFPITPGAGEIAPDSFAVSSSSLSSIAPGKIQWRRFLPTAVPLGFLSGLFGMFGLFGLLPLIASVIFAIRRYRPYHPGILTRRVGALLGATIALLAVPPLALIVGLAVAADQNDTHQELVRKAAETAAQTPELHNFAAWVATREGFVVLVVLGLIFYMAFMVAIGSITGALAVTIRKNRIR